MCRRVWEDLTPALQTKKDGLSESIQSSVQQNNGTLENGNRDVDLGIEVRRLYVMSRATVGIGVAGQRTTRCG